MAPDVSLITTEGGIVLQTPTGQFTFPDSVHGDGLSCLLNQFEPREIKGGKALDGGIGDRSVDSEMHLAKTLDRLDQLGLVAHGLEGPAGRLVTCVPFRRPSGPRPDGRVAGQLRLARQMMLRTRGNRLSLEMPGAWGRIVVDDTAVLALLGPLASGATAEECARTIPNLAMEDVEALLSALQWCGIIANATQPDLGLHELSFHTATRHGYSRVLLGKTGQTDFVVPDNYPKPLVRIALDAPDRDELMRRDQPFAAVSFQRRSVRKQGDRAIGSQQISEFLYRTLHLRDSHRPYPSGGACYPLTGYLALHSCRDLPQGLYRYDAEAHALDMVAESGSALNQLVYDAANAAGVSEPSQVLLILSARFAKTRRIYEDLSYSLILKEVGAVFQTAMLSATAMGLSSCPLGTGDAAAFSSLAGLDPLAETSVGELIFGTSAEQGQSE